nr:TrkA C-terminal domain-containing protein [Motilibacter aurantiacus]
MRAPQEAWGRSLGEARLRSKYGVTVVGVKRSGESFTYAQADTVVEQGDLLIVAAQADALERFAAETS